MDIKFFGDSLEVNGNCYAPDQLEFALGFIVDHINERLAILKLLQEEFCQDLRGFHKSSITLDDAGILGLVESKDNFGTFGSFDYEIPGHETKTGNPIIVSYPPLMALEYTFRHLLKTGKEG